MSTTKIEASRLRDLNQQPVRANKDYALYWMQQSQRAEQNPALEHAVKLANQHGLRLLVAFGLMDDYPEANLRHYRFLLEGLRDVADGLARRKIAFTLQRGHPAEVALRLAEEAALLVCDRGYLRHQKQWRKRVAEEAGCYMVQVEGDVTVPVEVVSDKREFAARTIRPKIHQCWHEYLVDFSATTLQKDSRRLDVPGSQEDLTGRLADDLEGLLDRLQLDESVAANPLFLGGTREGKRLFRRFLEQKFKHYTEHRNQPQTDDVSHMSKYLHFGQVSPLWLAIQVRDTRRGSEEDRENYLEELIVRRELAMNFCEFTPDYDSYACLPDWAAKTLEEHRDDRREHIYTKSQLEQGETHDPYWNAAMKEMRETGYMHNYMRMYWGKKIIEWTNTPEYAYEVALELNNKHFIDGRDPNSFGNVAWLFGNHDRPWQERPIFGKVRYMNRRGLERKCDPQAYVEKVDRLAKQVHSSCGGD